MKIFNFQFPIFNKKKLLVGKKLKVVGGRIKGIFGKRGWGIGLGVFLGIILLLGLIIGLPARSLYAKSMVLKDQAKKVQAALGQKDLKLLKGELETTNQKLNEVERGYRKLAWFKFIPWVKNYYLDGQRAIQAGKEGLEAGKIVLEAVEPYQDFLGLGGEAGSGEKTTEDRIEFLTESITGLKPQLDLLEKKVGNIRKLLDEIDSERYPESFKGIVLRERLVSGKRLLTEGEIFLKEGKPLIERMDYLLGKDEARNYLLLFQNDGEIRPTGGFWTAYGILEVENGKVKPLISEDIYQLDARFNSRLPAPEPIKKYLKNIYYWNLRDMNLSPDFKVSLEQFWPYFQKVARIKEINGVIAVDTNVLVSLLEILGQIGVGGWGNFNAEADDRCFGCPQVVYQLENFASRPTSAIRTERKGFLAPIMHSILANAMGSPKEKIAPLAQAVLNDLKFKHILFYFFDEDLQRGIEKLKFGGRILEHEGDYFHLNDTNLGGAKSNLFINQEVKHEYKIDKDGSIAKKVSVKYENTAPASNCNLEAGELCLNGLYRNWFRFYLPAGSRFEKLTGSEEEAKLYEELGKTVIEGFYGNKFPLYPKGISKVSVEYKLPFKAENYLSLMIQKQPGKDSVKHEIYVKGKKQQEVVVDGDIIVEVSLR